MKTTKILQLFYFLTISLAAGLVLAAPQPGDADFPMPSPCERHTQKVEAIKTGNYDLVMIGDSITQCVGDADGEWTPLKAVWDKHYAPRHAINLGYSGYRTENILWNLENGELDFKTPPKVVVLLIGTNNTDDQHYPRVHTAEQVFAGTKAIVDLIRQRLPTTKIIVLEILPCGGPDDKTTYSRKYNRSAAAIESVRRAGELAAKLADDKQVFWLDVNYVFLRPDGTVNTDLMPDMIHPNAAGAEARAQAIEPLLSQLMGDKPLVEAQTNTAVVPVPKLEECGYDWYGRHAEILKIKEAINPDLVFIGDSITHGWGGQPKASFAHAQKNTLDAVFPGHRCLNLGFGWDRTQNVLWRLDHGELDSLHPRAVILHIGTNNTGETSNARRNTPEEIVAGIRQIIIRIRSKTPEARIILMAVFPRGQNAADPFRLQINQINQLLAAEFGNTPGIAVLDIGPKLAQPDGTLSADIMFDFLHLTDKGYQIWADALVPLLK